MKYFNLKNMGALALSAFCSLAHAEVITIAFNGMIDQRQGNSTQIYINNLVTGTAWIDISAADLTPTDPQLGIYPGASIQLTAGTFAFSSGAYVFVDRPSGSMSIASSLTQSSTSPPTPYVSLNLSVEAGGPYPTLIVGTLFSPSGSINILDFDPSQTTSAVAATGLGVTQVPEPGLLSLLAAGLAVLVMWKMQFRPRFGSWRRILRHQPNTEAPQ